MERSIVMPNTIQMLLVALSPLMIIMAVAFCGEMLAMLRENLHQNRNVGVAEPMQRIPLDELYNAVIECGEYAKKMQHEVHRSFKADGSVLTEADTAISRNLIKCIRTLFPEAAVISEEDIVENNRESEWIFILDPIDGTDVYSQGMPAFAVSIGILDKSHTPVGAMIAAPRFGVGCDSLLLRMDPYEDAYINGEKLIIEGNKDNALQVTMGSKGPRELNFSSFRGKIRVLGSTIIHILAPLVFPSILWDGSGEQGRKALRVLRLVHIRQDTAYRDSLWRH